MSEYLKGNFDQADSNFQLCFNLFDGDPQLYYNQGLTFMMYLCSSARKTQYYKSAVMLEWCSRLDPHHPYAVNNLAYVYILLKKYKEASDACNGAYNINLGAKNYLRNWAIALMSQKLYGEAVEVIKEAIDNDPKSYSKQRLNVENWVVWGEVMKIRGEFEAAKLMYAKAARMNAKDPYPRAELNKLNAITEPNVKDSLEEALVGLSELAVNERGREDNCSILCAPYSLTKRSDEICLLLIT